MKDDKRIPRPSIDNIEAILKKLGKFKPEDELNCGACGYETCIEHAIAIKNDLAEEEMCLPYTIDKLKIIIKEVEESHKRLALMQETLIHSEKLASMGQLAAGIAHEINNPLGVILLYTHMLLEKCEKKEEFQKDLKLVAAQADRCKNIVQGLLKFSKQNKVLKQPTDLANLVEESIKSFSLRRGIKLKFLNNMKSTIVPLDPDQIMQVLINLLSNAIDASFDNGEIIIELQDKSPTTACIKIEDNGRGIPKNIQNRIFEPFFTTKGIGKGTGLGLALSYGIIKMHNGKLILAHSNDEKTSKTGTVFEIQLPKSDDNSRENFKNE